MIAVGLSVALFVFWGILGYALIPLFLPRRRAVPNLLLAPVVGVAVTELPLYLLSRAGLPIESFARLLTAGLLLLAVALSWYMRPPLPTRRAAPFGLVLAVALLLIGWPALRFGFNWVSFCNDDMSLYCLEGNRLLHHGFEDVPTAEEIGDGRDQSQWGWYMSVPGQVRPGSELLLAWTARLTGLSTLQAFMPLMLALHLVMIASAGTLVYRRRRGRQAAMLTCALVSVSAPVALGVYYQLIAQVGGLALLCGCVGLFLRPVRRLPARAAVRFGVLAGLVLAGLMLHYPEVAPFLGLGFFARAGLEWRRRRLGLTATTAVTASAGLVGLLLLGSYFVGSLLFLLKQAGGGMSGNEFILVLFPHFLIPEGLATLWGFQLFSASLPGIWLSVAIVAGALLLLASVSATVWLGLRGHPVALLGGVILALGAVLFVRQSGFGLFKLAMYGQPFLLGTLALAWVRLPRGRWVAALPLVLLALANVRTQQQYARESLGDSQMCEIQGASKEKPIARFCEQLRTHPADHLVFDTHNNVLGKLLVLHTRGIAISYACVHFCSPIKGFATLNNGGPAVQATLRKLDDALVSRIQEADFALHDPKDPDAVNRFKRLLPSPKAVAGCRTLLVGTTGDQTIVNRYHHPAGAGDGFFFLQPLHEVKNHLIFLSSKKGPHFYYSIKSRDIAIFQLEKDVFLPGRTMAGAGRHLLFEVLNPSARMRLEFEFTASLKHDGENRLPPAEVIGARRIALPLCGSGSARVFSPLLVPQKIAGRYYVAVDMGMFGTCFANRLHGLAKLWGKDIPRDRRALVGYVRNISAVSEEEYARLSAPAALTTFPADLVNPVVEYAGLYEDGWISDSAWCMLRHPGGKAALVFRGEVPRTGKADFTTEVQVLVDGREVGRKRLGVGKFKLRWPVPPGTGRRRIEFHFSAVQRFAWPDGRPATARIEHLGFEQERKKSKDEG